MANDTMMDKREQLELKKYKFEYRSVSRLKAISGNSGQPRFHRGVQVPQFPSQSF